MMKECIHTEIYNRLSDLGLSREEIFEKMNLVKERAKLSEAVYIWNRDESLGGDKHPYEFVFQCQIIDGKEYWFIKE